MIHSRRNIYSVFGFCFPTGDASVLPLLELLTLQNTDKAVSNREAHFPETGMRQLASHGALSYFPSTRSSWPYRTMKWCSENRSSSIQETTPVRLGHFLIESDMWSQTVTEMQCQFSLSQHRGLGWGWRVAALSIFSLKIFAFHTPSHSRPVGITVRGEVLSSGNPVRVPPGHLEFLLPLWQWQQRVFLY